MYRIVRLIVAKKIFRQTIKMQKISKKERINTQSSLPKTGPPQCKAPPIYTPRTKHRFCRCSSVPELPRAPCRPGSECTLRADRE